MKVYVCKYEQEVEKITTSKNDARDWFVQNIYDVVDADVIDEMLEEFDDLHETDLEDLMDWIGYDYGFYVTEGELESETPHESADCHCECSACHCECHTEQPPTEEVPVKHTYQRRSL